MSGRSGYRKTDSKRNPKATSERFDYVLRFHLPAKLAFAIAQGQHGWGVTVGFNDIVFVHGRHPRHCCDLTATFLEKVGAGRFAMILPATIVKLLPCIAHTATQRKQVFAPLDPDIEAIHDQVQRNGIAAKACKIAVSAICVTFTGATPGVLAYEFAADDPA